MKNIFRYNKIAAFLLFISSCLAEGVNLQSSSDEEGAFPHSAHIQDLLKQGYGFTLSLPVNATLGNDKLVHLIVKIPKGSQVIGANHFTMEFTPSTDQDPYNWSRILTTNCFRGKGLTADYMTTSIKEKFLSVARDVVILEEKVVQNNNYKESLLAMAYTTPNGRREIVMMKYFSGPYDCSGVQYAMILKKDQSEKKVLEKLKSFFEQNISFTN